MTRCSIVERRRSIARATRPIYGSRSTKPRPANRGGIVKLLTSQRYECGEVVVPGNCLVASQRTHFVIGSLSLGRPEKVVVRATWGWADQ